MADPRSQTEPFSVQELLNEIEWAGEEGFEDIIAAQEAGISLTLMREGAAMEVGEFADMLGMSADELCLLEGGNFPGVFPYGKLFLAAQLLQLDAIPVHQRWPRDQQHDRNRVDRR